jgi:hypothetical protein
MTAPEMIEYINTSLKQASPTGVLSNMGEKFIEERMKKSEADGGFSDHWKNISLEDALKQKG